VPDFKWRDWGGPRRVSKHIQGHPLAVYIRTDEGPAVGPVEVKPGSTVTVDATGHASVQHGEVSEMQWCSFIESHLQEDPRYQYKYKLTVSGSNDGCTSYDFVVPNANIKSGVYGWPAGVNIQLPDFHWWEAAGPYRVVKHLQDHPVTMYTHTDGVNEEAWGNLATPPTGVSSGVPVYPDDSI